ncbi:DUF302 domain-containing protein [Niabella ginsengisoli]|uniref:DUF302 domain-containing protein n=1 Tax=Niabella ginsengisoli TaxID=522298 RepID=A0ABS9SKI5_9BACT|nr:DUF302 domain-containing protein [Niabella ginsengisoli]MCH5598898.1 DUF302 domain-containing protein [Niabella ginsengisoli]
MKKTIFAFIALSFISLSAFSQRTTSQNQLKQKKMSNYKWTRESPYSVKETAERLKAILKHYPTVLFINQIDQQANAKSQGVDIDEMQTLLFQNNALVGALFRANPEAAFELPIKALIWKDAKGKTYIKVTDIDRLDKKYGLNGAYGAIQIIYDLLPPWLDILISDTAVDKFGDVLPKVTSSPEIKD